MTKVAAANLQVGGDHYRTMVMQPFTFAMINNWSYGTSSILRYLSRYRSKGGIEDLEKAKHLARMVFEFNKNNEGEKCKIRMAVFVADNSIPRCDHMMFFALEMLAYSCSEKNYNLLVHSIDQIIQNYQWAAPIVTEVEGKTA